MKLKTIYKQITEDKVSGIFYHGTKSSLRDKILSTGKFQLERRPGIYMSSDKNIALHYGYSNPDNVITIKANDLNIYYWPKGQSVPQFFFDVKSEDIKSYDNEGFDGFGIFDNSEVFVFNVEKLKIVK